MKITEEDLIKLLKGLGFIVVDTIKEKDAEITILRQDDLDIQIIKRDDGL